MSFWTAQPASAVYGLIDRACARDTPAELHYAGAGNQTHVARVRLIKLADGQIYADAPLGADGEGILATGRPVVVHTMIEGTRYAFRTQVVQVIASVALNARKRITVITLAVPAEVVEQQRREYYRISVAGHKDILVAFCATLPDGSDCCALNAERFSGRMVNISVGGLCVLISTSRRKTFRSGERFFAEFCLSDIPEPFHLPVEVRHFRKVHENTDTLVGFRFRKDVAWSIEPLIQRITRFVADEERRQLRRGRKR